MLDQVQLRLVARVTSIMHCCYSRVYEDRSFYQREKEEEREREREREREEERGIATSDYVLRVYSRIQNRENQFLRFQLSTFQVPSDGRRVKGRNVWFIARARWISGRDVSHSRRELVIFHELFSRSCRFREQPIFPLLFRARNIQRDAEELKYCRHIVKRESRISLVACAFVPPLSRIEHCSNFSRDSPKYNASLLHACAYRTLKGAKNPPRLSREQYQRSRSYVSQLASRRTRAVSEFSLASSHNSLIRRDKKSSFVQEEHFGITNWSFLSVVYFSKSPNILLIRCEGAACIVNHLPMESSAVVIIVFFTQTKLARAINGQRMHSIQLVEFKSGLNFSNSVIINFSFSEKRKKDVYV